MHPPLTAWYKQSMMYTLRDTWLRHNGVPAIRLILRDKPRHLHQRLVYNHFSGDGGLLKALNVVARRFSKTGMSENDVQTSLAVLRSVLLSPLPSSCKLALLRTVCNAWNTTTRYHQPAAGCLFGCPPPADDRMFHYLACPCIAATALRLLDLDVALIRPAPLLLLFSRLSNPALRLKTVLFVDGVFFTYNASKFGGGAAASAILAGRVKVMTRRAPSVF